MYNTTYPKFNSKYNKPIGTLEDLFRDDLPITNVVGYCEFYNKDSGEELYADGVYELDSQPAMAEQVKVYGIEFINYRSKPCFFVHIDMTVERSAELAGIEE